MIVTEDQELAGRMRYLSTQAKNDAVRYIHDEVGYNYRMTNIQAAMGVAQLEQLEAFIVTKRRNFQLYRDALSDAAGMSLMDEPPGTRSNYWFYSLVLDGGSRERDALMEKLSGEHIQARPIWHPNHLQRPYATNEAVGATEAEAWHGRVLNLPCSVGLGRGDIERICSLIRELFPGGAQ
jgi:perosamine synthetase